MTHSYVFYCNTRQKSLRLVPMMLFPPRDVDVEVLKILQYQSLFIFRETFSLYEKKEQKNLQRIWSLDLVGMKGECTTYPSVRDRLILPLAVCHRRWSAKILRMRAFLLCEELGFLSWNRDYWHSMLKSLFDRSCMLQSVLWIGTKNVKILAS